MNKKLLKINKGITLVALVVTIVVLLILAAITINLTLGENGLITKAKIAKNAQTQATEYETIELAKFECLDDEGNLDGTALKALLEEKITGVQISGTTFPMTVTTASGNVYTIAGDGNVEGDKQPGLYQYGKLVKTWQQLKDEDEVWDYDGCLEIYDVDGDIIISDEVTAIRYIGGDGITSITIPSSVTNIEGWDDGSVFWCANLKSIVVESGNPVYDSRDNCNAIIETSTNKLIYGCKNTTIPSSVTSFGDNVFCNCNGLTSITIPSSVTSIGNKVFYRCQNLESIAVESGNTVYDSRNNCNAIIETSTNKLIQGCKNTTIPSSVTSIEDGAFYDCKGLTSITIPNSVTSIGDNAFSYCEGLTSITIPSSVTSIGETPFSCDSLTSIVVENENTVYDSRNNCNAIIETSTNKLIQGCDYSTIPSGVTSIGDYAFYSCKELTSITIPNSVTNIGKWVFSDCKGLTSVTIPNSVTSMGSYVFFGCLGLTSIMFPESVTSFTSTTFDYIANNSKIYVPNQTVKNRLSGKYDTYSTTVVIDASKF